MAVELTAPSQQLLTRVLMDLGEASRDLHGSLMSQLKTGLGHVEKARTHVEQLAAAGDVTPRLRAALDGVDELLGFTVDDLGRVGTRTGNRSVSDGLRLARTDVDEAFDRIWAAIR